MTTSETPATSSPTGSPLISAIRLPDDERRTSGGSSRLVRFGLGLLVLLLLVGGAAAFRDNPGLFQGLSGVEYETATVTVKDGDDVAIAASGFVVPYRMLNVSPRIPGMVTKINFEVGQKVKKGDLLAQLEDITVQADLQQAQAAVLAARSRLEEAKNGALPEEINQAKLSAAVAKTKLDLILNEIERAKLLKDSTTAAEMDQLVSTRKDAESQFELMMDKVNLIEKGIRPERMKALEADVQQAEALVDKAKYLVDNTKILAPLDGTVIEKSAEVGEILRPEVLSVSLCRLADTSIMEVEVDVQERELHKIEIGRTCSIVPDAYPDRTYSGKIDRIQPMVIRARGVVRVTLRIDEPDQYLLPEMNVRATIDNPPVEGGRKETLTVPETAIVKEGEVSTVYVVENNVAHRRVVETGKKEGRRIEVASGVKAGETVVVVGDKQITDGQTIKAAK